MIDVEERQNDMAHALRRGPGWWMDPDGNWNPPEVWPESTPPLPDWVRNDDGTWRAPDEPPPAALSVVPDTDESDDVEPTESATEPTPEITPVRPPRTASSLSYSAYTKVEPVEAPPAGVTVKRALFAALGAGITAAMIAAGLTVLIGLF